MQRYFTNISLKLNEEYSEIELDTHHIFNVMRMSIHDKIEVVDSKQQLYVGKILRESPFEIKIIEALHTKDSNVKVTVFCPLLKGDKFDFMLQKSTELGASHFIIYDAKRSVVKLDSKKREKRLTRFEKIIENASKQSKRIEIPSIVFNSTLENIEFHQYDQVLIAYEALKAEEEFKLKDVLDVNSKHIAIVFGPEGGFQEDEIKSHNKFERVQLGNQILRAETAPLYMLSVIDSMFN